MKKILLILATSTLVFTMQMSNAQPINPGFETWTNDMLVPSAMNPNSGNNTFGWWDFNNFNYAALGGSPISVIRCTDTVRTGNYSVRLETQVYTPTSWNIYKAWGIPFIGHEYNDTLGILFNGKVDVTVPSYLPGIQCSSKLTQFKFYYQYRPNGNDTAECRVSLMSGTTLVAGGAFKTSVATGSAGWQQAVINFTYVNALTPDTLYVLYSSSSLDYSPKKGSVMWIDDASYTYPVGIEQQLGEENNFTIFPNPSNGIFSIQNRTDSNNSQTIEIFNVVGEKIYSTTNNKSTNEINISTFSKGVYFVKLTDGEKVRTEKIVVQ